MKKIKVLWVDDDPNFGPGVHLRYEDDLLELNIELTDPNPNLNLQNGEFVHDTINLQQPDLIMMDHNLEDVKINGANLIRSIRFLNHDTPIIYYSSEMSDSLINLIKDENNITSMQRGDVESSFFTLIKKLFS